MLTTTASSPSIPAPYRVFSLDELRPRSPQSWLWCLHCERFFQAAHLRRDDFGQREGCASCPAAGLGAAIWPWDAWREDGWPSSTAELHHGLRSPPA